MEYELRFFFYIATATALVGTYMSDEPFLAIIIFRTAIFSTLTTAFNASNTFYIALTTISVLTFNGIILATVKLFGLLAALNIMINALCCFSGNKYH